ncbi:MAG TPA: penicillin acylase family protein [Geminicoccaceae bacterium]
MNQPERKDAPPTRGRRWRRWLGYTGLGLLALALLVVAGGWFALRSSLPRYAGTLEVKGLAAPAVIHRDAYAIPRIEAASLADATFAQGFAHAQERLFQMEFQRRLGAGRLSEVVGPETLGLDRFMRTLGFYRLAEAALQHVEPETRRWLDAYAAGVNAFLETREGLLPPEFLLLRHTAVEPWSPADSLVWIKLMALDLSGNWRSEVLRVQLQDRLSPAQIEDLWPDGPEDAPVTLALDAGLREKLAAALPFLPPPGNGSNGWALAASRTRTGAALLANDPHLGMQAPGTWYLLRLDAPGFNLAGASLPGVPGIVLGHNGRIAWGLTTTGSDVQDLFIERLDPEDPGRYLTPEGSAAFEVRDEVIEVRDGAPVVLRVRATRHGPVISDLGGAEAALLAQDEVAALAWPALDPDDTTLQGLFKVMRADGWASFIDALRDVVAPQQNVFYADREGRIGLYVPGRVPVRRAGDGRVPVPGWTGAYDWTGWIPFGDLPHSLDPPTGELINANNQVVPDDYPYLLTTHWEASYRARRIGELIAGDEHDLARSAAVQADVLSMLARELLPRMLAAPAASERARAALERLRGWDLRMTIGAPEPLIFTAWYRQFTELAYRDELGGLLDSFGRARGRLVERTLAGSGGWCDDVGTAGTESCDDLLPAALDLALDELEARLGDDPDAWAWGEVHRAAMRHPIFRTLPVLGELFGIFPPVPGDGTTVNVAHPALRDGAERYASLHGPSFRGLYHLGAPDASRFMSATGQSGHPLSPHFDDLTPLWVAGDSLRLARMPRDEGQRLELRPPR